MPEQYMKLLSRKILTPILFLLIAVFLFTPARVDGSIIQSIATSAFAGIFTLIQNILGVVLYVAGRAFDIALEQSIYGFKAFAESEGIQSIWRISRDLSNMAFIFIMLYIAIGTILRLEKVDYKKMIPAVIIAALLINFSATIAKVLIIDPTNILAAELYQKMKGYQSSGNRFSPFQTGITAVFMDGLHLQKSFDTNKINTVLKSRKGEGLQEKSVFRPDNTIIAGIGSSILILVTAFVFFAGAILFIIRTVSLLFIIALAPFAFLFPLITMLAQYIKKWWDVLINQSLFAPIYMLNIYFVAKIINSGPVQQLAGGTPLDTFFGGSGATTVYFILLIGFMLAALFVAKQMGAMGTDIASKVGKWATGLTTAGVTGATLGAGKILGGAGKAVWTRPAGQTIRSALGGHTKDVLREGWKAAQREARGAVRAGAEFAGSPVQRAAELVKTTTGYEILPIGEERKGAEDKRIADAIKAVREEKGVREFSLLSGADQKTVYEKMSPSERVALQRKAQSAGDTATLNKITELRGGLGGEETDKTNKAEAAQNRSDQLIETKQKIKEATTQNEKKALIDAVGLSPQELASYGMEGFFADPIFIEALEEGQLKGAAGSFTPEQRKQIGLILGVSPKHRASYRTSGSALNILYSIY